MFSEYSHNPKLEYYVTMSFMYLAYITFSHLLRISSTVTVL